METITNSYEAMEMLKEVKANIKPATLDKKHSVVMDIDVDSLVFVIDEAIKCIDRLRLFRGEDV